MKVPNFCPKKSPNFAQKSQISLLKRDSKQGPKSWIDSTGNAIHGFKKLYTKPYGVSESVSELLTGIANDRTRV